MPCSCFGKKDKKAAGAAEEKYSRPPEQEPLVPSSQAPAQTQALAPAQAEPTSATPPAPHTPPTGGDARLRPEDDPDKASRRRDVVASFYSDQCELIGFKATGSRPPSAVAGEGPAATSSPLGSPPFSSRSCATSRADLAMKRREFFKDLAVNDISSARYGSSQPTWKLVDSGSLTTPRRSHQQDSPQHHTLPFQARAGGLVLRPTSTPSTSTPDLQPHMTNGGSEHSQDQRTDDSKESECEPLLSSETQQEPSAHYPQADVGAQEVPPARHSESDVEEPLLLGHQGAQDQSTPTSATPPPTPATPPATPVVSRAETETLVLEAAAPDQLLCPEVLTEPAATQPGGGGECGQLTVQQQYVQQVSVGSDDERLAEGSCILIKEAFPDEPHDPRPDPDTPPPEAPDTTSASGNPPALHATHEAAWDVSLHSSEQSAAPPPTEGPGQRRASLPGAEEASGERSPPLTSKAELDSDQHSRPTSSSGDSSAPGSPQPRQPLVSEGPAKVEATLQHQQDPASLQQEAPGSPGEARPDVAIVGCIPKGAPLEEADTHLPSPPTTPPVTSPPSPPATPAGEESRPPASHTLPTVDDHSPPLPTPPSLSEPGLTCGVDVSSSPLKDDGLGSDIDDALSSLECLTEEGNTEKRAAAST